MRERSRHPRHSPLLQAGVHRDVLSVTWMTVEAIAAIGAGIAARSIVLTAFGLDSGIERSCPALALVDGSAGSDLGRVERVERHAIQISGLLLVLLCVYVAASSVFGLLAHVEPERSPIGIAVAAVALVVMPYLAWQKRRIARRIGREALRLDAVESITCAYLARATLSRLVLTALFGWWWADSAAALVLPCWLIDETREALEAAFNGTDVRQG